MDSYQARKTRRIEENRLNSGRKLITCVACMGTGVYDNQGTPPCGSCDGTGRVREPLSCTSPKAPKPHWRAALKEQRALSEARRRS